MAILKKAIACLLIVACMGGAVAAPKEKKRVLKVPKDQYVLYLPGKGDKTDAVKDIEKQGWLTSNHADTHFSLLKAQGNKDRVLRFDTTEDNGNDMLLLPLSGSEQRITVLCKVFGAFDGDTIAAHSDGTTTGTPFSLFGVLVQKGEWQTALRHTAANTIKGAKRTVRLTTDGTAQGAQINLVDGWHDIRLVFAVAQATAMTSALYVDGQLVCQDEGKHIAFDVPSAPINWNDMTGAGNYLAIGDNDSGSKAFARYAYILVVRDDDVSSLSLEALGKKVKADLVSAPLIADDRPPASKRPSKKPARLQMVAEDFDFPAGTSFSDRSPIDHATIVLDRLPFSKVRAETILRAPRVAERDYAAVVEPTGADGAFKTIAEAIAAVPAGAAILVQPGLYYETLVITKSVSLIGTNPATTVIFGFEADTHTIGGNVLVAVYGSAPSPSSFFAENITFYNKGAEWNSVWGSTERRSVALAVRGVGEAQLKNCLFLGQQHTLWLEQSHALLEHCYIEGNEDIIVGNGTAQFDHCQIHALSQPSACVLIAPTLSGADDAAEFIFRHCLLTADKRYAHLKDGKKITLLQDNARGSVLLSNTEIPRAAINSASLADPRIIYAP